MSNSPISSGGLRLGLPIFGRALRITTRLAAESGRFTSNERPGDPPQTRTAAFAIWDLVASGEAPEVHLRWSAGLYNAADAPWTVPLSPGYGALTTSPEAGRAFVGQVTLAY